MVHQPGPDHIGEVFRPHHLLCNVQKSLHAQFGVSISSPWPRRGTCGPLTWSWPPWRGCMTSSFAMSCPLVPTYPIWGLYLIPMTFKRHLWSTNLVLATLERLVDLIIGSAMSNGPFMPNLGSVSHPHGLEEAPVVLQPGPGHLGNVG